MSYRIEREQQGKQNYLENENYAISFRGDGGARGEDRGARRERKEKEERHVPMTDAMRGDQSY